MLSGLKHINSLVSQQPGGAELVGAADFFQFVMNTNPDERPTAAQILQHPWLALRGSEMAGISPATCLEMTLEEDEEGEASHYIVSLHHNTLRSLSIFCGLSVGWVCVIVSVWR